MLGFGILVLAALPPSSFVTPAGLGILPSPPPQQLLKSWSAFSNSGDHADVNVSVHPENVTEAPKAGADVVPHLSLPEPNPFIPSEFTIKGAPSSGDANMSNTSKEVSDHDTPTAGVKNGRGSSKGQTKGAPSVHIDMAGKSTVKGMVRKAGVGHDGKSRSAKREVGTKAEGPPCPQLVRETAPSEVAAGKTKVKLWHLLDTVFLQPRAEIYLKVRVCSNMLVMLQLQL